MTDTSDAPELVGDDPEPEPLPDYIDKWPVTGSDVLPDDVKNGDAEIQTEDV